MGVSGSGKTTLGKALAKTLDGTFLEGDAFHSVANKDKMKKGTPLTDEDRLPWLKKINTVLKQGSEKPMVLACSALKNEYRKQLSEQLPHNAILWVYLHGEFSELKKRMEKRNHFMPSSLLQSQLETLEPPKKAIKLDCSLSIEVMIQQLKSHLDEQ